MILLENNYMIRDMLRCKINKVSQMILIYGALIAIVVGALIAMQGYFKRSLQGQYRKVGDVFGEGMLYKKP